MPDLDSIGSVVCLLGSFVVGDGAARTEEEKGEGRYVALDTITRHYYSQTV